MKRSQINYKMQFSNFLLLSLLFFYSQNLLALDNNFICPDDIIIQSCNDYNNTQLTGHPMMNNPQFISFNYEDELHLNDCNEGYIIRTWTGYNGMHFYDCDQLITLEYYSDFNGYIQWPPDWEGSCVDEIPLLYPVYDPGICDMMAHNYQDDTLWVGGSVCLKLLRNWTIIDWCKYQPNSGSEEGLWRHTQVLKVVESNPPELSNCTDWNVKAENADCSADFVFSKEANDVNCAYLSELNWKIEIDLNKDWVTDSTVYKSGSSIEFEVKSLLPGEHMITWTVYDPCGNTTQCVENVFVEDGKKPTPYCYLSFPIILMPDSSMLEVNAKNYVKDAIDNCTATEDLIHSWSVDPADSVRLFNCDDIGYQFLPLYTIDESGNYDFCFVFTRVVTHGDCPSSINNITGLIRDFKDNPVEGIKLSLGEHDMNQHPVDTSLLDGTFSFPYIERGSNPSLYLESMNAGGHGLTTLDLVVLQKYLLGLAKPTDAEAFHRLADMNYDNTINIMDLILMRAYILGLNNNVGNNENELIIFVENNEAPGTYTEVDKIDDFQSFNDIKVIQKGDIDHLFILE